MSLLRIDSNAEEFAGLFGKLGVAFEGAKYGPARDAFRDIRDLLIADVRTNMTSGSFVPNTQVTRAYKARAGLDSRPMFATGNLFAGIDGMFGGTFAAAMRGYNEWYVLLHHFGKGYGPWSREGWSTNQKGARKATWKRKHRKDANPPVAGVTHFPMRDVFFISDRARASVLERLELFYQTACDEVANELP